MAEIRTVTLAGSGIRTTAIGFGCSNLLGDKTRQQGLALLEAAYDAGVRHFDVARYYGFGDAEGIVGEFAAARRDKLTITTKFGLQPMKTIAASRALINGVRRLMRASGFVRKLVRRNVRGVVQQGLFDVSSARASIEQSLRALRTDYIDVLLMHEGTVENCTPALFELLLDLRNKGNIRSFGVGSAFPLTQAVCNAAPQFTEVAQFDSNFFNDHVLQMNEAEPSLRGGSRTRITHGSLTAIEGLLDRMRANPEFSRAVSNVLGRDATDKAVLAGLVLADAVRKNPNGVVLFRSTAIDRIQSNILAYNSFSQDADLYARLSALKGWPNYTETH